MIELLLSIDLTGKAVVVTGAGGVLYGEMVRAFAQARTKVTALDLNEEAVKKLFGTCRAEGLVCEGYKADVLDSETLAEVHAQACRTLGPCDTLTNGAGGNNPRATTDNEYQHKAKPGQKIPLDLDTNGADFVFRLNPRGTLLLTQAFVRDMVKRGSGCIPNTSSMNAYTSLTKTSACPGAKTAISNFTQRLATYLAGIGTRCNAIASSFLVSNQNRKLLFNEDGTPTPRTAKIPVDTPIGRFVESNELLGGVSLFYDDRAVSVITGVVLPIDMGFTACSGVQPWASAF